MELTLKPTLKQHLAWQELSSTDTVALLFGGAAGGGKSWLGCEWLLLNALRYPGSRWFMARNELKRLMNSTFVTFKKVSKHHKVDAKWKLDGKYNVIRFSNGSVIDLLDVSYQHIDSDYQRFGSLEYNGGFGEEVGEWVFKAFDVLKSRIGRNILYDTVGNDITPHGVFYLSCNPNDGWSNMYFYKPWKENKLRPGWKFIPALASENHYVGKNYIKQLDDIVDDVTRQRLKDGTWNVEDPVGKIMETADIMDIFTNVVDSGPMAITVDVARFGSDRIIINVWNGLRSIKRIVLNKLPSTDTAFAVREVAAEYKVPYSRIVVDDDGIGGGVADLLKGCVRFIGNSSPIQTIQPIRRQVVHDSLADTGKRVLNFINLKAQCSFLLAEFVSNHRIACENAEEEEQVGILEEIRTIRQKDPDAEKKLQVVSKLEVRQKLGRSPDVADTFVMRMILEVRNIMKTMQPETPSVERGQLPLRHKTSAQLRGVRSVAV